MFGPGIQSLLGCGPSGIDVARPSVRHRHRAPDLAGGPWLTVSDAAFRIGISAAHLGYWIRQGRIRKTIAGGEPGRRWRLLDEAEIDALARGRVRGEHSRMLELEAAPFTRWLRTELANLPISRRAFARMTGVSDFAIKGIETGAHRPRLGTALRLAESVARIRPGSGAAERAAELRLAAAAHVRPAIGHDLLASEAAA